MLPPVFPVIATAEVKAIVGTTPARIYDFNSAPQDAIKPYITFTNVTNAPFEQLSGAPRGDFDTVQIDMYAGPDESGKVQIRMLALAVRKALDDAGIANRLIIQTRETDTKLFRISIEADFIHSR